MTNQAKRLIGFSITALLLILLALPVTAAYKAHNADLDAQFFLQAYPAAAGSKLDNCYLCHASGMVGNKFKDSCDYCHAETSFGQGGDILKTLNSFGLAYNNAGRNKDAFAVIANTDADGDGFTNEAEIRAGRLPGDKNDNPDVQQAPAKYYTRAQLRQLPETSQFMAVDTAKAGDYYATYSGVDVWTLLQDAGVSPDATDVTLYAADGYSKNFPISDLQKDYAQGRFYTKYPWITSPLCGYQNEEQLPGKLRYILAYEKDGFPLEESKILAVDGRSELVGEGPYRFISPLSQPVVPDRSAYAVDRDDAPYPYNHNRPIIRNGDYCIKSIVAIQVNTEANKSYQYDWNGKAWEMIEKGELVVYGAINPK